MNRVLGTTAMALCLLSVTTQTWAGPPHHRHDNHYYRTAREVPQTGYEYAEVVDVDPIVRQVRVEVPRKECFSEVQQVYPDRPERVGVGPALVGGLIGGVIGNQFGHGRGRHAATAAGALIGASIANDTAARRARYAGGPEDRVVERCDVRYEQEVEERIDGYRVRYLYNGREYSTRLPYDPGDRIKIRVAVEPAE